MKRTYRNYGLVLLVCIVMGFGGCTKQKTSPSVTTDVPVRTTVASSESETKTVAPKVKLGSIATVYGTQSFNDDIRDGIKAASDKYGIENICLEVPDVGDAANSMRTLIGQGANFLIIGSADYQDAMIEISEEYPDVKFLYLANLLDQPYPNIMTTEYAENEGAFLLGALAGMLTKTNNVGTVAAVKGDSVQEKYTWGFSTGAKYANSNITVQNEFTNSYADINTGNEVATVMYQKNADIVSCYAGACNLGVFNAANSAGDGKYCFGAAKGQFEKMPNKIIASLVKPVDETILAVVGDYIDNGVFSPSKPLKLGLATKGVIVKYTNQNDALLKMITPEIDAKMKTLEGAVISGKIVPPSTEAEYKNFAF